MLTFGIENVVFEYCSVVTNNYFIAGQKFTVEDQYDEPIGTPRVLFYQFDLTILPLHQFTVISTWNITVSLDLQDMFDLVHEVSDVIALRNVHSEAIDLQIILGLYRNSLILTITP